MSRPGFLKSLGVGNGASLERRLRKELEEQGILESVVRKGVNPF